MKSHHKHEKNGIKLAESVVAPQPRIRQGFSGMPATHDESMRTVCHTMNRCEPCGPLWVAPCLQGGPRLVAHRLRWGPHVTGKQGQRARSPGHSARGLSEDLPGPPRPRCSRGSFVQGYPGIPPRAAPQAIRATKKWIRTVQTS